MGLNLFRAVLEHKYVHNLNAFFGVWHEKQYEPKIPKWNPEKERIEKACTKHSSKTKKAKQTKIY